MPDYGADVVVGILCASCLMPLLRSVVLLLPLSPKTIFHVELRKLPGLLLLLLLLLLSGGVVVVLVVVAASWSLVLLLLLLLPWGLHANGDNRRTITDVHKDSGRT